MKTGIKILSDHTIQYQNRIVSLDEDHLYLDAGLEEDAAEGSGVMYRDISVLLEEINGRRGREDAPVTVYIAPSVYWLTEPGGEDGRHAMPGDGMPYEKKVRCRILTLEGLCEDARDVVVAGDRGQSQGCVGNYTMFQFTCEELNLRNLTVGNYCNVDLDYPLDRTRNRPKRSGAISQAQLGEVRGERFFADNCRFVSRLNLMPMCGAARSLYRNCHFECTDDALNGHGVYLQCDFDFYGRRPLYQASPLGCVFLECVFRIFGKESSLDADQYFMKNAGSVMALGCVFEKETEEEDSGLRVEWTKYPPVSLKCYEYRNRFRGQPYSIASPGAGTVSLEGSRALCAYYLETEGQPRYNVWNLLHGGDGWDPLGMRALVETADPGAGDMPVVLLGNQSQFVLEDEDSFALMSAEAYTFDGRRKECKIFFEAKSSPGARLFFTVTDQGSCRFHGRNTGARAVDLRLRAYTEDGLETECLVSVKPKKRAAPVLKGNASIRCREGFLCLDYALQDPETGEGSGAVMEGDASQITWYRCRGEDRVPVAVSRDETPSRRYRLCGDDVGGGFQARLVPRFPGGLAGEALWVDYEGRVQEEDLLEQGLYVADFASLPLDVPAQGARGERGRWIADFYEPLQKEGLPEWHKREKGGALQAWGYGELGNGCIGKGLHPLAQGTRLFYLPGEEGESMSLRLVLDPAKTAGQGFGSAGQYLDVCLKFDPLEMSGYALRIIRTPKAADGVSLYLVRYCRGSASAISKEVVASCFLTDCHIGITATEKKMDAEVYTTTPISKEKHWETHVKISAVIEPTRHTAFGVIHTGTMGNGGWENSLLLHQLSAKLW